MKWEEGFSMQESKVNKKSLLVIFLTVFIDLVGFGIIIPLSPYLAREFGADAFQVGLLMSIYSVMQFFFAPMWGQYSDRFGRRPIILISLFGAGLSHAWFGLSHTLLELFLARALAGFFGANISTAMAYIADVTPPQERSKGMGLIGAAFGLGFILGPFIGGIVSHYQNAQAAAYVAAGICFFNFLLAARNLKESWVPTDAHSKSIPLSFWERHWRRLSLVWKSLGVPVLGNLMWIYFLATFAMAHMEASLFLFVQDRFGWDLRTASLGFAYVGVVMVLTQGYFIRKLLPKIGERKLMVLGLVLGALGLSGVAISHSIGVLTVAVTLLALGSGFSNPAITGSVSLLSKDSEQGSHLGVNQSLSALARVLGPATGGWVYRAWSLSSPFFLGAISYILAAYLALRIFSALPDQKKAS